MPDQLPSAILESTNSFDSIFALDIDTKQRFDNILNNQQKPIDYPIPDYNKDFTPQGLPQDDLLNPQKMKGSLGEALFSTDPRIADLAVSKMRMGQSNLPVNQGIGVPDRFQYTKAMDKFLNGDYGYNPYLSLEDNEDFNYRYDYMSHTGVGRLLRNIGTGTARFVGSVALKLGQTLGYMGSMISEGVQEIFNGKDNNFMADVADNSLSRWFEGLEEDMKNSNLLSVFKPRGWEDMGFFQKLGNGAFWTDEIADGAAFMGEMIASMYLLGGLGKIGSVGRFGATEINLTKALSKLGPVGRYGGKGIDAILKTATGSKNLSDVGRWAFATTSESAFEASQLYKTRKEELKGQRQSGQNSYTDEEIEVIAGDSAAASFKANMLILSASNAFENRFIFNPLFKKFRGETPNPRSRLISVSEETDKLDNLARASRTEYNYSTWLGKKLNLKDPNSRLRFYGSRGLSAFGAEGLWEENAQLAVERLASVDNLSFNTFVNKIGNQTVGAFTGSDKEAQTAIGLGTVIGIGGTGIVSKVAGGDKERYKIDPNTGLIQRDANGKPLTEKVPLLQRGERRKREYDTATAVAIYEQYRRKFLNFQDIYVRDEQTGKPVLDEDDNLQIDDIKAAALLDGINAFASKQEAASKVYDPMFRKFLQDNAMTDFVTAAKSAGIFDRSMKRFSSLGSLSAGELQNLGFDPNTVIDHTYLKDSMKEFGNLYDKAQNSFSTLGKDDTQEDDDSRKNALFKASATVYSTGKILNEYQSAMMERDFPSAFSPEAEGNTSEIQQYNSLVRQKESLDQWSELAKENGNFYEGFIRSEKRRIESEMARLEAILDDMMENTDINLKLTPRGFVVSDTKYDALKLSGEENYTYTNAQNLKKGRKIRSVLNAVAKKIGTEIDMNIDIEEQAQKKHAELTNERARQQYLINKFSSVQNGIKNYKDYIKFHDSIQKKDGKADEGLTPPPNAPTNPNATPPSNGPVAPQTGTTAPINPVAPPASEPISKKEALAAEAVVSKLTTLLSKARAAFISGDPDVSPDFKSIANLINENPQHKDVIIKLLKKYAEDYGQAVIDQIQNGTYNPEGVVVRNYQITSEFFIEVTPSIEDDDIVNAVNDYLDSVDAMIESYKEPELSELEVNAVAVLRPLNLQNTALVAYAGPINDPNASAKDVKDALRGISDQLLDQNTAEVTGTALGQAGSQAIEDLGYEAPAKLEIETKLEEAPKVNSKDDLIAAQKADIERRKQVELNVPDRTNIINSAVVAQTSFPNETLENLQKRLQEEINHINLLVKKLKEKGIPDEKIIKQIKDYISNGDRVISRREGLGDFATYLVKNNTQISSQEQIDAKYDAEIAALEESEGSALKDVVPVFHHTKVDVKDFDFGNFQRGKNQVSQFGDGLAVSTDTTPFLQKRYGNPIKGEVKDSDFVVIDTNKTEKEIYEELKSKGYKFNKPDGGSYIGNDPAKEYDGTEKANEQPAIISLFNDFQKSNPEVKGVKIVNHIIANEKVSPFYVIYDNKSFYGEGSLKAPTQYTEAAGVSSSALKDVEAKKVDIERRRQELGLQKILNIFPPDQGGGFRVIVKGDKYETLVQFTKGKWDIFPKQKDGEYRASDPETGNALVISKIEGKKLVEKYLPKELIELLEEADSIKNIDEQQKFENGKIKNYISLYRKEWLQAILPFEKEKLQYYKSENYPNKDSQERIIKEQEKLIAKYDAELAALESNLITEDTNEAAIDKLGDEKLTTEQEEQSALKVGDRVVVNTKKDGTSTIKEIRGDKALLEDGRQVALTNLTLDTAEPTPVPVQVELNFPVTQAEQASADTEGSSVDNPPPPPEPPAPQENSDKAEVDQDNFIDIIVDEARKNGVFTFPQNMPEEIVMEGNKAKISNGAIQLKTTVSDQSRQLLRQHNILKNMGEQTNPENFWSEDEEGKRKYKVRLEMAGDLNANKYAPWIYNTAKGLINPETGKPYRFPFMVAMVVDNDGNYVYFDDNGNISTKSTGMPFGFIYTVEDYKKDNLKNSRRGNQLKNGESLNGVHGFLNNDPLKTMSEAVAKGVQVIGDIIMVTSGKLSTYNVDNSGSTWAKDPQQRTVRQMIDDGDLDESASMVLGKGRGSIMEYASERAPGAPSQRIKVGQPYILDDRSGYRIPLRGKKLKDLTVDGKPFVDGQLKAAIEKLQEDGTIFIDEDASPESQEILINLFNMIRALVYSQNTPLFMNEAKTKITLVDKRPTHIPLMETEINYSTGISILTNPFEENSEGFDYEEFVKENFLSGAVPAELVKGKKNFEKLNKRIIFTLEKNHQQLLDAIGAKADTSKVIRMQMTDYSKFVNKTFRKKGTTTGAITVTGYSDGKFTITGNGGTVTRTPEEFMKELRTLEEVKLPTPTDEVTDEMAKDIKLSKQKIDEIREQSKNMTDEDVNNLDFGC